MLIGKAGKQELGHKGSDLFFWKIDHAHDLPTYQLLFGVMLCDLCARPFDAVRAKINPNLIGRLPCFRKIAYFEYRADTQFNLFKIMP